MKKKCNKHIGRAYIQVRPLSYRTKNYGSKLLVYRKVMLRHTRKYRRGGALYMKIKFYFRGPCDMDIDNMTKPIMDCLEGHWFYNDKQIKSMQLDIVENNHRWGIWLEIGHLRMPR